MTEKIASKAEEQVLALFCGDAYPWTWGGDAATCSVTFNRDGTGTLHCGENQRDWIAVEHNWSFTAEPVVVDNGSWKFSIQMTLTTRITPEYHAQNHWLKGAALQNHLQSPPPPSQAPFSWAPLHSAAFRSKQYTLTLSRGRFIEPFHLFIKRPYPLFEKYRFSPNRYASQLVFDTSPYPPHEEWAEDWENGNLELSLNYHRHWERREFVRDAIAKKDETWAETLDLGWWLSPTAGDGYVRGR